MSKKNFINPDITETIITRDIHVKGDISSHNDIWVDGHVEGNITTDGYLTLGQNAQVEGNLAAKSLRVGGSLRGNVKAEDLLACESTAVINGDIHTSSLSVDDGAIINGTVTMPEAFAAPDEE